MINFKGGDGSAKQQAIIILGANSEAEGVDAEYDYLDGKYREYEHLVLFWVRKFYQLNLK